MLRRLFIFLIFCTIFVQSLEFFKESEACMSESGEELNCPSNWIYYFECCAKECCLRTQIVPAVIIGVIALIMTICCILSSIAYCCFGD
ncbi:unnamed protein product [Caenorhabditis angaria]|uniref:Uncharacterized protein n=1 Tax=Caenorhabditis angaria TaxID=860376 RepID=A0A9P1N4T5_9PELO|nr:unnamed protein product [Caenorhabditis angaria]